MWLRHGLTPSCDARRLSTPPHWARSACALSGACGDVCRRHADPFGHKHAGGWAACGAARCASWHSPGCAPGTCAGRRPPERPPQPHAAGALACTYGSSRHAAALACAGRATRAWRESEPRASTCAWRSGRGTAAWRAAPPYAGPFARPHGAAPGPCALARAAADRHDAASWCGAPYAESTGFYDGGHEFVVAACGRAAARCGAACWSSEDKTGGARVPPGQHNACIERVE